MLGVQDDWAAYQVDHAILLFALAVESKLSERKKDGKPKHRLDQLLLPARKMGDKAKKTHAKAARGMVRRRVQVREDGTW